jgi:hypothetical protein
MKTGDFSFEQKCTFVQFQFKILTCFTYIHFLFFLQADEPSDDPSQIDEYMTSTTIIEEGFKGE